MQDKYYEIKVNLDLGYSGIEGPVITFNSSCVEKNNKIIFEMEKVIRQTPLETTWQEAHAFQRTIQLDIKCVFDKDTYDESLKNPEENVKSTRYTIGPLYTIAEIDNEPKVFKSMNYLYFYEMFY